MKVYIDICLLLVLALFSSNYGSTEDFHQNHATVLLTPQVVRSLQSIL